jgi:hypothetical protein
LYQDRLGTNIGKALKRVKERDACFLTVPSGFEGEVIHVTPLPEGQNYSGFCLTLTNLTIFSGVAVPAPGNISASRL